MGYNACDQCFRPYSSCTCGSSGGTYYTEASLQALKDEYTRGYNQATKDWEQGNDPQTHYGLGYTDGHAKGRIQGRREGYQEGRAEILEEMCPRISDYGVSCKATDEVRMPPTYTVALSPAMSIRRKLDPLSGVATYTLIHRQKNNDFLMEVYATEEIELNKEDFAMLVIKRFVEAMKGEKK